MTFNLNKSDGSAKSAHSKFNLSKSDTPGSAIDATAGKSRTVVYVIVGLLAVAIGCWYLLFNNDLKPLDNSLAISTAEPATNPVQTTPVRTEEQAVTPTTQKGNEITADEISSVPDIKNRIPVSFASGATAVNAIDQSVVTNIFTFLSAHPEASIEVRGYASSEGSIAMNQFISQARADAFKDYLVSRDVSANRIMALGKGIENPIASNQTAAGRKKNRRVEVDFK